MKRWHEELPISRRRFWSYNNWLFYSNGFGMYGRRDVTVQYGRYRKRKPLDCGNPQCGICHSDKFPKRETTYREWVADLKFREGLAEL